MDAMRCLLSLRMTRRFRDEPVSDDALRAILEAGRWCGSSKNTQPWHFLVIRDRSTLRELAQIVPYGKHLDGAALGLALVMDGAGNGDSLDAGRLAEHFMLAAHAVDVGSCISTIPDDTLESAAKRVLGVPADKSVRVFLSLGYPAPADPSAPRRAGGGRRPLADLVRYDRFGESSQTAHSS